MTEKQKETVRAMYMLCTAGTLGMELSNIDEGTAKGFNEAMRQKGYGLTEAEDAALKDKLKAWAATLKTPPSADIKKAIYARQYAKTLFNKIVKIPKV